MSDTTMVTGVVATDPRHLITSDGVEITSFRLASTARRFDGERWIDQGTNWYTITAFRDLAVHSSESIQKGHRIVATGRLRVRDWENDGKHGTTVELEADTIGHDLRYGTTAFARRAKTLGQLDEQPTPSE